MLSEIELDVELKLRQLQKIYPINYVQHFAWLIKVKFVQFSELCQKDSNNIFDYDYAALLKQNLVFV